MNKPLGYNPLRWDCKADGCFNTLRRPKIEVFADCFPGRINFGDVDGLVEINGHFCLLEWKGDGGTIHRGQYLSFKRFTEIEGNVVFVIHGDPETMNVLRYSVFWKGKETSAVSADLEVAKERIRKWVDWAKSTTRRAL